ncbi:MAG: hypothetical protein IIA87_05730 [Nanoarchaeota archaeon]|nr:hypothetical protein [Nanoarchaeota archaeon]
MVYKKYIKRGNKIYGPYLYHSHRENGKVVTNYVGKYEVRKKNNKFLVSFLLIILVLFAVGIIFYYQYFTGRVVEEGGATITTTGSGGTTTTVGSGGKTTTTTKEGTTTITRPNSGVSYSDPQFSVDVPEGISGITVNNPIVVSKPEQGVAVINQLVRWESFIDIPRGAEISHIKVSLPINAKYARVIGTRPVEVTVKTRKSPEGFLELFSVGRGGEPVEVVIKNPQAGNYEVSFFTNPSYISEEKLGEGFKRLKVINPSRITYNEVSIFTKLGFIVDPGELRVVSRDGDELVPKVYDSDGDGDYDSVRFIATLPKLSEQEFEIRGVGITEDTKLEDIKSSVAGFNTLSEHCKEDLLCRGFSSCAYNSESNEVLGGEVSLSGTKRTVCISDKSDCPAIVERIESCSIAKKIDVVKSEDERFQRLIIKDIETGRVVAELTIMKKGERDFLSRVDIIFK